MFKSLFSSSSFRMPEPSFPSNSGSGTLKKIGGHVGETFGGSTGRKIGEALGEAADRSTDPRMY